MICHINHKHSQSRSLTTTIESCWNRLHSRRPSKDAAITRRLENVVFQHTLLATALRENLSSTRIITIVQQIEIPRNPNKQMHKSSKHRISVGDLADKYPTSTAHSVNMDLIVKQIARDHLGAHGRLHRPPRCHLFAPSYVPFPSDFHPYDTGTVRNRPIVRDQLCVRACFFFINVGVKRLPKHVKVHRFSWLRDERTYF